MSGNTNSGRGGSTSTSTPSEKVDWKMPGDFKGEASECWNMHYWALNESGILTDLDFKSFVRLCRFQELLSGLLDVLSKEGHSYETQSDAGKKRILIRPEADKVVEYQQIIAKLEMRFGLNPKDRQNLKAFKPKKPTSVRDKYI